MTLKVIKICRKCSSILVFMLFFQQSYAQYNFTNAQNWMTDNLKDLGGRAVLVVLKDGKLIYSHAENEMTRKQKMIGKFIAKRKGLDKDEVLKDFDVTTKERIASCSKWLSAALVMTFVDEGKLKLEDTIGKFLPIFSANGKGNITIWQCLSHLTGIKQLGLGAGNEIVKEEDYDEEPPPTKREKLKQIRKGGSSNGGKKINPWTSMDMAIDTIARQPMEGEPGKTFHYGNAGLQIAAAIVEKVGGKSFETLFAERIAKPCNMKSTDFGKVAVPLAAGGAFSTPADYINFLQMLLNNGQYNGRQVISPKSILAMQINRVKGATIISSPAEAGNWGYGFGEWVMEENSLLTSTKGGETEPLQRSSAVTSPGMFGSFPWVENEKGYCAFLFTFNIKSKGRNERYKALKKLVDVAVVK